jgi:hypothetical protein
MSDLNPTLTPLELAQAMLRDDGVIYSGAEYRAVIAALLHTAPLRAQAERLTGVYDTIKTHAYWGRDEIKDHLIELIKALQDEVMKIGRTDTTSSEAAASFRVNMMRLAPSLTHEAIDDLLRLAQDAKPPGAFPGGAELAKAINYLTKGKAP